MIRPSKLRLDLVVRLVVREERGAADLSLHYEQRFPLGFPKCIKSRLASGAAQRTTVCFHPSRIKGSACRAMQFSQRPTSEARSVARVSRLGSEGVARDGHGVARGWGEGWGEGWPGGSEGGVRCR